MEQQTVQTSEIYPATGDVTYLLFTLVFTYHLSYEAAAARTMYRPRITRLMKNELEKIMWKEVVGVLIRSCVMEFILSN